ncbi:MocR-like pyridoxine biosynthesis transcription factor PdxR [Grimontia sp. NTOU-MAR1]|uniref:MocR-like pyridoxine biosynthesis transcription factor PdxR n=1 Tax=Grimontia sp. NTOU-MAR1 TaxID=3111011 RepID=UPI002DB79B01|nr:PLP-dependent aminotransferase family protein [Grimontia sp. NTOU-MAR1]WRW00689.1 PLP-dependent aminotransferase family protein [Grimontia sp. NTOU-MAR1]
MRKGGESIHTSLSNQISEDIRSGRLASGHMMPGSRTLALQLGVNRKTVQQVYEELESQGWLISKPRRGTYVADMLPELSLSCENQELVSRAQGSFPKGDSFEAKLLSSHHVMGSASINDGVPDTRLIPFELLSRAFRRAIVQTSRQSYLGYGDPRGTDALRQSLQRMLNMDRFMNVTTDQICVVRGSQMAIYLSSKVLDPAKGVLVVESLSYSPAVAAFESNGFDVVRCQQDERGLDVEHLEKILSRYPVGAVYTTPHHQYPTTVSLSMDRRLKLLQLSKLHGFAVLEDDYDHEFHYESRPIPPLASLPNSENVIHIGSLSKVFAPGLRLGYMVSSPTFIHRVAEEITLIDRQGSTVTELAVADLMQSGDVKKHIRKVRRIYQARRDHAANELKRIFGDNVLFRVPPGGLALWIDISQLPKTVGDGKSGGFSSNFPVLSGSKLFSDVDATYPTHLRFGFGALTEHEITFSLEQFAKQFK